MVRPVERSVTTVSHPRIHIRPGLDQHFCHERMPLVHRLMQRYPPPTIGQIGIGPILNNISTITAFPETPPRVAMPFLSVSSRWHSLPGQDSAEHVAHSHRTPLHASALQTKCNRPASRHQVPVVFSVSYGSSFKKNKPRTIPHFVPNEGFPGGSFPGTTPGGRLGR